MILTSERFISLATLLFLIATIELRAAASLIAPSRSVSARASTHSIPSSVYIFAAGGRPLPRARCAAFHVVQRQNHRRVNRRTGIRNSFFRAKHLHGQPSQHDLEPSFSSESCVGVGSAAASRGWGTHRKVETRTNRGSHRLFSSHSPLVPPSQSDDDDLQKWERMYSQGGKTNVFGDEDELGGDPGASIPPSEIRVVTFDLDNTLWKTSHTIGAANDALYEFIENRGLSQPRRVEKVMGDLFRADGDRYCPGSVPKVNGDAGSGEATKRSPVLLTLLRTDAIKKVCMENNGFTDEEAEAFALEAFQVWTEARHMAIPDHYATSVVSCLREIRGITTSSGHPVIVGAVTDGNSDPRNVPDLRDMFDFCVNSESVGVSKPDERVYRAAIEEAARFPALQEVLGRGRHDQEGALNDHVEEELVGPWWVHVGDDFLKDVVPAKELKMRTVFATELLTKKGDTDKAVSPKDNELQSKKRDVSDLVKELSSMKVVEMTIGADDFLVESMQSEFIDAKIDRFHELSKVIIEWHSEALRLGTSDGDSSRDMKHSRDTAAPIDQDIRDVLTVVYPDEKEGPVADTAAETMKVVDMETSEWKFCVFCGTKNPKVARFCVSCGEQQPEVP